MEPSISIFGWSFLFHKVRPVGLLVLLYQASQEVQKIICF